MVILPLLHQNFKKKCNFFIGVLPYISPKFKKMHLMRGAVNGIVIVILVASKGPPSRLWTSVKGELCLIIFLYFFIFFSDFKSSFYCKFFVLLKELLSL